MYDQLLLALAIACATIPLCLYTLIGLASYAAANGIVIPTMEGAGLMPLTSRRAIEWRDNVGIPRAYKIGAAFFAITLPPTILWLLI